MGANQGWKVPGEFHEGGLVHFGHERCVQASVMTQASTITEHGGSNRDNNTWGASEIAF